MKHGINIRDVSNILARIKHNGYTWIYEALNLCSAMTSLSRVVALVTGAASGLGRATAARIARHGGRVVICDVQKDEGEQASSELGDGCIYISTDVRATWWT